MLKNKAEHWTTNQCPT